MLNGDLDSSTLQATAFTGRSLERRRAGRPSGCGTMVGNESRTLWLRRGPGVERVLAVLVGLSCAMATARAAAPDVIYVGTVVTMESASPRAEAVAVAGERVVTVGKRAEVLATRGPRTRIVELGDGALLPGFIDSHGHLTASAAQARVVNLQPPPAGPIRSIGELQEALRRHIRERAIPPGEWVTGFGYDDGQLAERRHPNRDDLDAISREHPIFLTHSSGHLAATNSRALAESGIASASADPDGGAIRRRPGTREPDGVLEETAAFSIQTKLPAPSLEQSLEALGHALDDYASRGITTIQDGGVQPDNIALLRVAAQRGILDLDVVAYRYWIPAVSKTFPTDFSVEPYRGRLRFGGIKIGLDGSPQGKTAFLSEPYFRPPAGQAPDYRGYPAMPTPAVVLGVRETLVRGMPLLAHANGDAAAEILIDAVAAARRETGRSDPLVVMIHAQTVRDDQLDRMLALNIMPSFFVGHVFYWGDWHRDAVGTRSKGAVHDPQRRARRSAGHDSYAVVGDDAPYAHQRHPRRSATAHDRRSTRGADDRRCEAVRRAGGQGLDREGEARRLRGARSRSAHRRSGAPAGHRGRGDDLARQDRLSAAVTGQAIPHPGCGPSRTACHAQPSRADAARTRRA